ncbi:MAG: nitrilase-related carbon-nitrogen hydrolase [Candidatus Thorarchaeota archaeon]
MEFDVSLLQMPCKEGDRKENFGRAEKLLRDHKPSSNVEFIMLPELFAIGFRHSDYTKHGEGIRGPTSDFACKLSEQHSAYVVTTGIEKEDSMFYNTLIVASPSGKIIAEYRKIHPFQEERDIFLGGDTVSLVRMKGITVGLQTCYDLRFPEITRKLALEGAEIILQPAAWPDPRSAHWNSLIMARAIENQLYFVAANRIGWAFDGKTYFGHSQVVDPWGIRFTRMNSEERVITTSGDTAMLKSIRQQITCYQDRSPTGYDKVKFYEDV